MFCSSRSVSSSKEQQRHWGAAEAHGVDGAAAVMPPSCRHPRQGAGSAALVLAALGGHLADLGLDLVERDEAGLAGVDLVEFLVHLGHAGLGLVLRQLAVVVGVGGVEALLQLGLGLFGAGA